MEGGKNLLPPLIKCLLDVLICLCSAVAVHPPREVLQASHELTERRLRVTQRDMAASRPEPNTIPHPPGQALSPNIRPTPTQALLPADHPTSAQALSPTDRPTERLLNRISSHVVYDHLFSVAVELGVTEAQFSQTKAASNNQPRYHIFKVSFVTLPAMQF